MNALERQVAGSHYKKLAIQPIEYIHANNIPHCEACVIKYVSRWRDKGGITDLRKAIHYIELIIQMETEGLEKLMPHIQPVHTTPQTELQAKIQPNILEEEPE